MSVVDPGLFAHKASLPLPLLPFPSFLPFVSLSTGSHFPSLHVPSIPSAWLMAGTPKPSWPRPSQSDYARSKCLFSFPGYQGAAIGAGTLGEK